MSYFPKMKKLIAVTETTCLGCGVRVDFDFDTYILEADSADGTIPGASAFKLVTYQQHFGPQAYCVQIPSRYSPDGGPGYMAMAANFAEGTSHRQVDGVTRLKMSAVDHPTGGTYGLNLQATRFCGPKAGVACTPSAPAAPSQHQAQRPLPSLDLRVRLHIIRNERIENVCKSQSCMVSKLRIICKQTVARDMARDEETTVTETAASQPNPADDPVGQTAAGIWVDTNIRLDGTNASASGFASFNITGPSDLFTPLAIRYGDRLQHQIASLVPDSSPLTSTHLLIF